MSKWKAFFIKLIFKFYNNKEFTLSLFFFYFYLIDICFIFMHNNVKVGKLFGQKKYNFEKLWVN